MSQKLISRSSDLKKLKEEGYAIGIKESYLIISEIPYINSNKEIKYSELISELELAGDKTSKPSGHTVFFTGDYPCDKEGNFIEAIRNEDFSEPQQIAGKQVKHKFSNKPPDGYKDYFEKMDTYIKIISHPAKSIDPSITAKTNHYQSAQFQNSQAVFHYNDTNLSRSGISELLKKFMGQKIAIIGLGGTGSYILDLISKTPVSEIHLFDEDKLLNHNAFRTPGSISLEQLKNKPKKVNYLKNIYSNMHKKIQAHCYNIEQSNFQCLLKMNFIFVCIDQNSIKKSLFDFLCQNKISFIDVGIGIHKEDEGLSGTVRLNLSSPSKTEHLKAHIPLSDENQNGAYSENIQIADINALNASLAVIKWKKQLGFYADYEKEYTSFYTINTNTLTNRDHADKT